MIERTADKARDGRRLGADEIVLSGDPDAMAAHARRFDLVLNTIPGSHDVNPFLDLLGLNGPMVMIGALTPLDSIVGGQLMAARRSAAGTAIGGMVETQEMIDFSPQIQTAKAAHRHRRRRGRGRRRDDTTVATRDRRLRRAATRRREGLVRELEGIRQYHCNYAPNYNIKIFHEMS